MVIIMIGGVAVFVAVLVFFKIKDRQNKAQTVEAVNDTQKELDVITIDKTKIDILLEVEKLPVSKEPVVETPVVETPVAKAKKPRAPRKPKSETTKTGQTPRKSVKK